MKFEDKSFVASKQFEQKNGRSILQAFILSLTLILLIVLNAVESMTSEDQKTIKNEQITQYEKYQTKTEQNQQYSIQVKYKNPLVIIKDDTTKFYDISTRRKLKSLKNINNALFSSFSQIKQFDTIHMKATQTTKIFAKRGELGYSYKSEPILNMWIVINQRAQTNRRQCFIINSVLVVTQQIIENIANILNQKNSVKILILTTSQIQDEIVKQYLTQVGAFKLKLKIDSDYQFVLSLTNNCLNIAYSFSNFKITNQMANRLLIKMNSLPQFSVFYTSRCLYRNKQKQLKDLTSTNLQHINPQQFYNYLYIIDIKLLLHSAPLNFAYYAKYTLQQILILPILSLVQQSGKLITDAQIYHQVGTNIAYFQQFRINAPHQQINSISFISYPSDPTQISEAELNQYLSSFHNVNISAYNVTLVIHLPYKFGQSHLLLPIYEKLHQLSIKYKFSRIKLRTRANKTVSTLSIYQSVYIYCPNKSLIVSSRHNVKFKQYFIKYMFENLEQKFHLYYANYFYQNTEVNQPPFTQYQLTKLTKQKYFDYFQHFQIFKSDLMKNMLFWLLKCQEVDFYQNQYVFMTYWMEQLKYQFKYIGERLVTVTQRNKTVAQQTQLKNLLKYMAYSPYMGKLFPYLINCLQNQAYRRNASYKIQRNIHQVWIGQRKISSVRWRLHQSLIQKNPNFNVTLWTFENITHRNLPIGTRYRQKILQLDSVSRYSYLAAVTDIVRFELLYTYGGIYCDFKYQGLKPMDNFLKYEVLFLDTDTSTIRFDKIKALTYSFIGAPKNSYYFKMILTEQIREQQLKIQGNRFNFLHVLGSYALRKVFTYEEVFSVINLGFHLIYPTHYSQLNQCEQDVNTIENNQTTTDRQVFYIRQGDDKNKVLRVTLPCQKYEQSYMLNYISLGKTWVHERRNLDEYQLSQTTLKNAAQSNNKL